MCGIAGWLGFLENGALHADHLMASLRHRGPDAQCSRTWPEATLVHTRLSIIDVSTTGAQPMSNEDGRIWVVFNGEIYNHHELRTALTRRGHIFRGRSDTEILPHLYEEKGSALVEELRGMFAIAIYDRGERRLMLFRDRFGIKPLFYAPGRDRLAFASEIRALIQLPGIDLAPDRQAIHDFMALSYIPAPETFHKGVRALEPGELLTARFDGKKTHQQTRRWHQWTMAADPSLTLGTAAGRAETLLDRAVASQMESDVPLGAFLSGGIDSSLVSVAAQKASGGALQTFSERFADSAYDESEAARAVAQHISSGHHTLEMDDATGAWSQIEEIQQVGQPFADTSFFATHALCRLIRKHVTVALSGDGGDEAFGGYPIYWWIEAIIRWQELPASLRRLVSFGLGLSARAGMAPARYLTRANDLVRGDDTEIVQYLFCQIREKEHRAFCIGEGLEPVRRLFEPHWNLEFPRGASRLDRLSAHATEVAVRLKLPNDYLVKVDMASMKESLEVRVPMLDEELFSFGLSLPHRLRVKRFTCKRVLREVARRRLPRKVARKPKHGFEIPLDTWTTRDFKEQLRTTLLGPGSGLPEFVNPAAYRPMIDAFCDGKLYPGLSRESLCLRATMLLSIQLALQQCTRRAAYV